MIGCWIQALFILIQQQGWSISVYIYIQLTDDVSWFFHCIFAFVPDVSCCAPRIDPADYSNHFIVAWSSIVIHDMQLQIWRWFTIIFMIHLGFAGRNRAQFGGFFLGGLCLMACAFGTTDSAFVMTMVFVARMCSSTSSGGYGGFLSHRGDPKSSIYGFSMYHPAIGDPPFMETSIWA